MNFRLEYIPALFEQKICHQHQLFLAGSCFTEQIGSKLSINKFKTLQNPNGIMFNPESIANAILSHIDNKHYTKEDLFFHHELWGSWDHHTKFSSINYNQTLLQINQSINQAHEFLKSADWMLLTLGSAFVYQLEEGRVVANCHKVPADKFHKRMLQSQEIKLILNELIQKVVDFNPKVKIIFTISPVRHLREGFIENNRSKAQLISAVHELVSEKLNLYYFPAYELVIDDLRDYRFYAEDMVHPNYAATNYVWEKFIYSCMDENTVSLMKEIAIIHAARQHKPFNPASQQHKSFQKLHMERAIELQNKHAHLDFSEEIAFFRSQN